MHLIRRARLPRFLLAVCALLFLVTNQAQAWRIVTWNLLNYAPGREAHYKTVLNVLQPDVLVVQEMQGGFGNVNFFLNQVLNAADGPGGYAIATFTDGFGTDNAMYYRTSTVSFGGAGDHIDLNTTLRQIDRWFIGPAGYTSDAAKTYVYSMHLKAGSSASDMNQRGAEANILRNNANLLTTGTRFVFLGDMNLQSSTEPAWVNMTGNQVDNDGRAFDPINMPGSWSNNSGFAGIHTQSPHSNNSGAPPGGAFGGMDDRFDFILISQGMNNTLGMSYVAGTYDAFGNDGLHFNSDINDPPTIPEGSAIADALHSASDHLPVVADFRVAPVIGADIGVLFGTHIEGADADMDLNVYNAGDLATFGYVAKLFYSFTEPAGFDAPAGAFNDDAGGGMGLHTISMDTTTAGNKFGWLNINSNDPDTPVKAVGMSGTVLRASVPSLSGASQSTTVAADFGAHIPGGFLDQNVDVHNFGFDSLQALLEVYDAQFVGPDAGSFSLVGGFSPFQVGGAPTPVSIAFDDSGSPGMYSADLVLSTRDQQDVNGAANRSNLTIQITADLQPGVSNGGPPDTNTGPVRLVTIQYPGSSGLTLSGSGLTPGERVVIVAGRRSGKVRIPGCFGHRSGLVDQVVVGSPTANERGEITMRLPVRIFELSERLSLQVIDPTACRVSDPLTVVRP